VQDTKLTFSEEELGVMQNSRFFEVKHEVTQKILQLLGELEKELVKKISGHSLFSMEELKIKDKGKIFRGENYRLMPYLVLDCPRIFNTDTIFAFRSMFRWGNELSFTLHLQGKALEIFRKKIQRNISSLIKQDFFICVNDTPWEYTYDEMNYKPLDDMMQHHADELKKLISDGNFLKLSRKISLENYRDAVSYGTETFEKLIRLMS
jgi:hypothetical protein